MFYFIIILCSPPQPHQIRVVNVAQLNDHLFNHLHSLCHSGYYIIGGNVNENTEKEERVEKQVATTTTTTDAK